MDKTNLLDLVKNAKKGDSVIVDDLCCCDNTIYEIGEAVLKAYHKEVFLASKKQPWFSMNAKVENPMITIIRLVQLGLKEK